MAEQIRSKLILFAALIVVAFSSFGQVATIKGRVLDSNTLEVLPFANVFINNTTLGSAADSNGNYLIKDVPAGSHDLIFSFVGYETFQKKIQLKEGELMNLDIRLIPLNQQLETVEVKSSKDKEWQKQLRKFEKIFLGDDANAAQTKVLNPWVLDFKNDGSYLVAQAVAPLEIENRGLGYRLFYYLKSFKSDGDSYSIVGNSRFEEITISDARTAVQWMKNRELAYFGSSRHLFKAILDDRVEEDGFRLYIDRVKNVPRSNNFQAELSKNLSAYQVEGILPGTGLSESKIQLKGRIEVHYVNSQSRNIFYKDIHHAVSWLEVKGEFVRVNQDGVVLNSADVTISGDMGANRIANILPLDYKPGKVIKLNTNSFLAHKLREKVYVMTDKPYYYPGEVIWLTAFVNYKYPQMADSLSRVLHVELMDAEKKVIQYIRLKIDSGRAYGNLTLKPQIKNGDYLVRAYTRWSLNYGPTELFSKPISILNLFQRVVSTSNPMDSLSKLSIRFDQPTYAKREKVKVTLQLSDDDLQDLSLNAGVVVTDVNQVAPVTEINTISNSVLIPDQLPTDVLLNFKYPIERGNWISGTYVDGKARPNSSFALVQNKFEALYQAVTDAKGHFVIKDMSFSDSVLFAIQMKKSLAPKLIFDKPEVPFPPLKIETLALPIEEKDAVQRVISKWEVPQDAILLEAVEVKDVKDDAMLNYKNPYGKPDYYVKGDDISKYGFGVASLFDRLPGYQLVFSGQHWYIIRQRGVISSGSQIGAPATGNATSATTNMQTSVGSVSEPVVFVDNVQMVLGANETAGDRLVAMNSNTVDHVEVSSMIGSQLGATGANGLIAIYTKLGDSKHIESPSMPLVKLKGFDVPLSFNSPEYDGGAQDVNTADYRATLYWNPNLKVDKTGKAEFSFFTSDLKGPYRIVIEGIDKKGNPVRGVAFISVN